MFLNQQNEDSREYYQKMLKAVGSISKLFSDNSAPYYDPRIAENLFCKTFDAENLARQDNSVDAKKGLTGIGIKTFLHKGNGSFEKVAEFNRDAVHLRRMDADEKVIAIANLRNERVDTTRRIFGFENMIYHCVTRKPSRILIHESEMKLIDIESISSISENDSTIYFKDRYNEYRFNLSKSVLLKKFPLNDAKLDVAVQIIDDPFFALENLFSELSSVLRFSPIREQEHIFLPLYSYAPEHEKIIPERSGLNQWNAGGRSRNCNEIYIPIPALVNRSFEDFFPSRDTPFNLKLPNGEIMSAKVCQDGSKALMSNPNTALGRWLLRDVMNLREGELLTYEKLARIGLDSVIIYKTDELAFDIDFAKVDSFEDFKDEIVA